MLEESKRRVQQAMDARRQEIALLTEQILKLAELGYREKETAGLVRQTFERLGIRYQSGLALTGVKASLAGGAGSGPTVAVIGELDALPIPSHRDANPATGAAHACGHNAQTAMVLAVAMGLVDSGIMDFLSGRVVLFTVPAEELVDIDYRMGLREEGKIRYLVGKPELVRQGHFDDVDMAMMVHNTGAPVDMRLGVGTLLNGCVMKKIVFHGRAAHAGASPHLGINALNAADLAFAGIHAQRETFRDEDAVRVHWIITRGGTAVNVVPSEVEVEMFVRARRTEALAEASRKVDRALRAGAMAIGARISIQTLPGYLPNLLYPAFEDLFRRNGDQLLGEGQVQQMGPKGGSTDLGDLSHIMPAIHPFAGGATGNAHGVDWHAGDVEDAVLRPAKAMAMTVIDLLAEGASRARSILATARPPMTKQQYLEFLESLDHDELYDPEATS